VRVLFDTTFARRSPHSGTGVYIERLGAALAELPGVELIEAYNRRRRPPGGGGVGSVRNALGDQWWTEVELVRLARVSAADVIHHPLPANARRTATPQVITVHDLAFEYFPEGFDDRFRRYARWTHAAAARRAAAVVCVSETTASDVCARWGVAARRLVVAAHGPGQRLPAVPAVPAAWRSHFLYVGDDEPRKNLAGLLAAYAQYREAAAQPRELVLAGAASASAAGVRCEPRPEPERLARLYAEAVALVHPASYEGFGMTPLEAMGFGTPVIAATAPGTVEVCGDAARYVDPRSLRSLAAALAELSADGALRDELARRGRRRVARYSWAASARRHRDAYSLAGSR
jgi:glycosyltransferase involved in cell wall biosynthesis